LFVRRQECINRGDYRHRSLAGPAILVTIGAISLIDNLRGPGWDRTWPIILLVLGAIKLMERGGHFIGTPSPMPPADVPPAQQPPTVDTEVKNG
jgi:hypothetical protein